MISNFFGSSSQIQYNLLIMSISRSTAKLGILKDKDTFLNSQPNTY